MPGFYAIIVTKYLPVCASVFQEAIAIILDIGPTMNQAPPGEATALQTSLDAITMILQRKVKH